MMNIGARLRQAMTNGNLTVADLARWFDRPDPTVRGWANGRKVRGPEQDLKEIRRRLLWLEALNNEKKSLPVPQLPLRDRIAYVDKLKSKTR